jgi:hypothetical protein
MDTSKKRPPSFKISVPGDDAQKDIIFSLLHRAKDILVRQMNRPVNNADILEAIFKTFLDKYSQEKHKENEDTLDFNTFLQVEEKDCNQKIFLTAESSLKKLVNVVENHSKFYEGGLPVKKVTEKGYVAAIRFNCSREKHHSLLWSLSPYLPDNRRVVQGFECSGMLPVHYVRFSKGAKIGCINQRNRSQCLKTIYSHIEAEYEDSIDMVLWGEVGCQDDDGINMMTDARHGWRKNAKDCSVVALGEDTHQVIKCEHLTKMDDPVSQRHEKVGTERIYHHLQEKGVAITVHTHDRNLSIGHTINQNDTWHGVKSIKIKMKKKFIRTSKP